MRSLLAKLRRSALATRKRRDKEPSSSSSVSAQGSSQLSAPICRFDVVQFVPDEKPDTNPEAVYLSLSSDLRILPVRRNEDPPSSLLSFRRPMVCFKLTRIKDAAHGMDLTQIPLRQIVASRVAASVHQCGPAVRISEGGRTIQLVAKDEVERDLWLSALTLRLAPLNAILCRFQEEVFSIRMTSNGNISVVGAAKEMVRRDADSECKTSREEGQTESLAKRLWTALGLSAQLLTWTSSFGQTIAGSAKELEELAKPFCQVGVVGCAFSLVSLSARMVHLLATERDGMEKLQAARKTLHGASLALCEWLVEILDTGFEDEKMIKLVFDVMEECWDAVARLEEYVLLKWASRVWKADEVKDIEENSDVLRKQLLSVGVLKFVSTELKEVKKRVDVLEDGTGVAEVFRSFLPDPGRLAAGLLSEASKTIVDRLKELLVFSKPSSSGASDVQSEGNRVCRVVLASMSGEGGVGKTSACRLLCADRDVQNHFSGGAILWISLGPGVSDEKVKERISSVVADCGGYRTAESIRRAASVYTAIDYARQFFNGHCVLLVVDNVWKPASDSDGTDWMGALSRIATYPGSVVLMTTRFRDLCLGCDMDHVPVGRLNLDNENGGDWKIAETMYDRHMSKESSSSGREEQSDDYQITRTRALRISCGLPLAIASICGLIRLRENSAEAILALIMRAEKEGGLAGRAFGKETASVVGHAGLYAAMAESLEFLDRSEQGDEVFKGCHRDGDARGSDEQLFATYLRFETKPVSARYAALKAMDKSGRFSFSILAGLWHLNSADDAEELSLMFANVGLGRIVRSAEFDDEDFFVLHDLQFDFCSAIARQYCVNGHLLLLSGCMPFLGKEQCWTSFCFSGERSGGCVSQVDDVKHSLRLHMGRNLFHLLSEACVTADECTAAKLVEVMIDLLTDFCWLRGRGETDGRVGVVADFRLTLSTFIGSPCGVSCCTCSKHGVISVDTQEAILLIRRVIERTPERAFWHIETAGKGSKSKNTRRRLSAGDYLDGGLASNIAGRLHQALMDGWDGQVDVTYIQKLIASTEANVRSAWMRYRIGIHRCLPIDKRFLTDITVGSGACPVSSVSSLGDGAHVVSLCDGVVRIHNIVTAQTVLSLGNGEVVCATACESSRKGTYLVFYGGSGVYVTTVRKDIKGNIRELGKCTVDAQAAAKMAVSRNGNRLAAVFSDANHVSIWNHSGDGNTVCYATLGSFRCDQSISNLAMSVEGDLIVSSAEKEVLVWRLTTETRSFKIILRFSANDEISSTIFCEDAKSLIVGTQNGFLEIWSLLSKSFIKRIDISCPQLSCVMVLPRTCLGGSCETMDDLLVTGNYDSVKVFNFNDLRMLHEWRLYSVLHSVSALKTSEGNLIVAGSSFGSLSVRDVMDLPPPDVVQQKDVHESKTLVQCISIAAERGILLSGHQNGMLCTWDLESGNFVRSFEGQHDEHITCIDVSDDEDIAVSGSWDGSVKVWEISSLAFRLALEDMSGPIASVRITPTNRRIISYTIKGCMRALNRNTGSPLFSMRLEKRSTQIELVRSGKVGKWIAGRCKSRMITMRSSNVRTLSAWKNGLTSHQWATFSSLQGTSEATDSAPALKTETSAWFILKEGQTLHVSRVPVGAAPPDVWVLSGVNIIGEIVIVSKPYMPHSETLVVAFVSVGLCTPVIMHCVSMRKRNDGV